MNQVKNPMRLKPAAAYDAAADHFDEPPLAFWDRHGQRTIALLQPRRGGQVLDVGCGTGASALPAAAAVGPTGHVTGLDVAENMLMRARAKAHAAGLENVTFRLADMAHSGLPDESFDAIVSVFSIFFVADMERLVGELWRMLRPGGRLAVTVWGPRAFEPGAPVFGEELRRVRPDIPVSVRPWERLTNPDGLRRLLCDGGTRQPWIEAVRECQRLSRPADFWTVAMGSGYRWEIEQLTSEQQRTVRERMARRLSDMGVDAIETNAIHALAEKGGAIDPLCLPAII